MNSSGLSFFFFKQKTAYEILAWTGVQTCALPISLLGRLLEGLLLLLGLPGEIGTGGVKELHVGIHHLLDHLLGVLLLPLDLLCQCLQHAQPLLGAFRPSLCCTPYSIVGVSVHHHLLLATPSLQIPCIRSEEHTSEL